MGSPSPLNFPPRGLSRTKAAAYVGISPGKFDQLVSDGRMPKPIRIDRRKIWDLRRVDEAFDAFNDEKPPFRRGSIQEKENKRGNGVKKFTEQDAYEIGAFQIALRK